MLIKFDLHGGGSAWAEPTGLTSVACGRRPDGGDWAAELMVTRKGPVFELYCGPDKQAASEAAAAAAAQINAEMRREWSEWRESPLKSLTQTQKEAHDVAVLTQTETD
jgi:hypothetical protein